MSGECVRCLDPVTGPLEVDLQELYAYPRPLGPRPAEPDEDDEHDLPELEGDLIDLEPVLRDAVVLALPLQPLCRDDCPGLCPECGARLADDPEHHARRRSTPAGPRCRRWSTRQLGRRRRPTGTTARADDEEES